MKTADCFRKLLPAVLAALLLAGCSKDLDAPSGLREYSFVLGEGQTRSLLAEDAVGKYGKWENGDRLGTAVGSGSPAYSNIYPGTPSTFRIYRYGGLSAGDVIYAYYPYSSDTKSISQARFNIPSVQKQNGADFDFDAMPMAAEPYVLGAGVQTGGNFAYVGEIHLQNLASVIQYQVFSSDGKYASETVRSVTFAASVPVSGAFTKDVTAIVASDESTLALPALSGTSVQTLLENGGSCGTVRGGGTDVYMVVAPGSYGGRITVVTDAATYTYTLSGRNFRRSGLISFGLDLSRCQLRQTEGPGLSKTWLDCYEVPAVALAGTSGEGYNSYCDDKYCFWDASASMQRVATHTFTSGGARRRNYTVLFDGARHCPLWSAFAMHASAWPDEGVDRTNKWIYDPAFEDSWQQTGIDNASAVGYSKGHLVASNYRKTSDDQNAQTFYYTNQAPQWQNSFNSGVWSTLEGKVKDAAPSGRDTLYVVAGVLFEGGDHYLPSGSMSVAIPSHFYKCLMMCSFDSEGEMTAASGIAYLYTNEAHKGITYDDSSFITTIDAVEEMVGIDFFHNVPPEIQNAAERSSTALWK